MLYSEIIAVCSQIHTKHINTLCGQNLECRTYRAVNTLRLGYKKPVSQCCTAAARRTVHTHHWFKITLLNTEQVHDKHL